jgi:hypothetical protein
MVESRNTMPPKSQIVSVACTPAVATGSTQVPDKLTMMYPPATCPAAETPFNVPVNSGFATAAQ